MFSLYSLHGEYEGIDSEAEVYTKYVGKVHYVEYVLHSQYMWCSVYSSQLL